jgi:multidrug resistance protein, MATE family
MSKPTPFARLLRSPALPKELRTMLSLALPLMLGELCSILMGVAGAMMTGHLGETALAASGVAGVVYVMAMLLIWGGIRMVPTPVAEAHELRDAARVRTLVLAGGMLFLFFLIACCTFLWVGIWNFDLLGQDPEVARMATDYLRIIFYSMPVLVLFGILVNYIDAFGFVRITMYVSILGLAIDVLLNWLFIFGKFGLPRLGLHAIAINTGFTHLIMTLALGGVLLWHPELAYFRKVRTQWADVWAQTKTFVRLGVPSAMQILVEFAAFAIGTVIIGQISKTEQAAHQIAINLIGLTYVTIMGISTAGMIRVGQALAYSSRVRIGLAGLACIGLALAFMVLPTLVFIGLPAPVVACYTEEADVAGVAIGLLLFAGLFQFADAVQATSISLLRAMSDIRIPTLLSFISFWVIGIPLGYWLAHYQGWRATGVWMGYLVALIVQAVFFVWRFNGLLAKPLTKNSIDAVPPN